MVNPKVARIAIAVYGIFIAGGGLGAFVLNLHRSTPSNIANTIAAILLARAFVKNNVPLALGTAVVLALVFAYRLGLTRKFVPPGVLLIASLIACAVFTAAIYA